GADSFPASDAPPWTPRVALGAPGRAGPGPEERHRPAIERPLAGAALGFNLQDELAATENREILERSGRTARTLVKDRSLRVTIHLLAAGGAIPEHHADGPITVQVLRGALTLHAAGREHELREGDLLALDSGVAHSLASLEGAAFLLTVSLPGAGA
ncbi:MAG TPA: cupin domain-containing protein, partial [Longimicrobiales bacterium]